MEPEQPYPFPVPKHMPNIYTWSAQIREQINAMDKTVKATAIPATDEGVVSDHVWKRQVE